MPKAQGPREFRGNSLPPEIIVNAKLSWITWQRFKHIVKAEPYWSLFLIMVFACKGNVV